MGWFFSPQFLFRVFWMVNAIWVYVNSIKTKSKECVNTKKCLKNAMIFSIWNYKQTHSVAKMLLLDLVFFFIVNFLYVSASTSAVFTMLSLIFFSSSSFTLFRIYTHSRIHIIGLIDFWIHKNVCGLVGMCSVLVNKLPKC